MKNVTHVRSIIAILIISAIVLLYGCSSPKQGGKSGDNDKSVQENGPANEDANVNIPYIDDFDSIRQYVERHVQDFRDNRESYNVRQADYTVSTEGGTIEGYYAGDALKHVEVNIYGEMGRISYNIYYVDESLRYFVETTVKYDNPIGHEGGFNIVGENRKEYLIINERIHEYTSDLKTLSDTDIADYKAKFRDFEKALKNAAVISRKEQGKIDPNDDDNTVEGLKKKGFEVFENQSFDVSLDAFGKVKLIIGCKEDANSLLKLKLYLADKESKLIYEFPDFYGNRWPMLFGVSAVLFKDADNDGLKDVIVIADYITGAGENGAAEFPVAGVYFQKGKEFISKPELDEKINSAGANSTIEDVIFFLAEAFAVDDADDKADSDTIVPVAFNGLLAGSFYKGRWLDAKETVPKIGGNKRYGVYSNFKHIGNGTGSMPYKDNLGRDYIALNIENAVSSNISITVAIGKTGDVRSVVPRKYSKAFYFDTVKDFLGQRVAEVFPENIIQGISADLDNDGKGEHLISVCSYNDSDDLSLRGWYKENNNYSYLLLARETKNGFDISVVAEAPRIGADRDSAQNSGINEGEMMIYRSEYFVFGLIDIDGDKDMDLVCRENIHEGTSYYVYEYKNSRYKQVLSCSKEN